MDFSGWRLALKNVFMPIFCRDCGGALLTEDNGYFCPECWSRPERIERPFCCGCGKPHRERIGFGLSHEFHCADCRAKRPPPYRRVWAACDYDGAIESAIKLLKFHDKPRLARPLAEEICRYAEREIDLESYDAIVPVPLHRVRRRARGFNQSELIAAEMAHAFPRARLDTSLRRIRPTRQQSTLTRPAERAENVRGAFAVDRDCSFAGQRVLLVDDVVTSGGTAAECARALLRAGAETVEVIAVAIPAGRRELDPVEGVDAAHAQRRGPLAAAR